MSKMKINLIKGPNFDLVEKKTYGILYNILSKKEIPARRVKKDIVE